MAGILLTIDETAVALGRPAHEVRRLISDGVIPAVKLSPRRTRIPRAALEAWLDEQSERALQAIRSAEVPDPGLPQAARRARGQRR